MENTLTPHKKMATKIEGIRSTLIIHDGPPERVYTESELEAERKSNRELVQVLVDDLRRLRIEFGNCVGRTTQIGIASLELAASKGITPTHD